MLCAACYAVEQPGRDAFKIANAPAEICCACGTKTVEPIYDRAAPRRFGCHGNHDDA